MLSLEIPAREIDGLVVYADHAEPRHFYYAAPQPRIARSAGRLAFDLLAYTVELEHSPLAGTSIPDELGAGFLNLAVECPLSETKRSNLRRELASEVGVSDEEITLAPIPYHKGSVSVIALDAYSAPANPDTPPTAPDATKGRPTFVEQILGAGIPSLIGDLRTIFSLGLSQNGVTFLEGLFEEKAAPIGVVYDLKFYGLRPAIDIEVFADLSRIYKHFGGGAGVQYQWFGAEISAALDKLAEDGAFEVKVISQAVGVEAAEAREQGLAIFKDQIVQQMFRPTTQPPSNIASMLPALTGGVPGTTATGTVQPQVATTQAKVAFRLEFKEQEELKTVHYRYNEVSPEERTHAPQGFLPVILQPSELAEHIHTIDLRDTFFETLQVLVTGPTKEEFEALGIRQVEATLTYGKPSDGVEPDVETLLFRPESTGDKTFAAKRRERTSLAYDLNLVYEFVKSTGVDADTVSYELPPKTLTRRTVLINPYDDFGVLDVELELGRIHPSVKNVAVGLTYLSPTSGFAAQENFVLTPGEQLPAEKRRWQVRTQETEVDRYQAVYIFMLDDGTMMRVSAGEKSDPLLRIDDPFVGERELRIIPNVTSADVTELVVELEYEDPGNAYQRTFTVPIAKDASGNFPTQTFRWPILDRDAQQVSYRVTTRESGFVSVGEWAHTEDPSIEVGAVGSRQVTIEVRLVGPPLAEVGVDALHVKVGLPDAEETKALLFEGTQTSQNVTLTLPPGTPFKYRYTTTAFRANGQTTTSPAKESADQLLVLPTRSFQG